MNDLNQKRINRINQLLDRLERIPEELDRINERLFNGGINRYQFACLVDNRNALLLEKENKEHELNTVYRIVN